MKRTPLALSLLALVAVSASAGAQNVPRGMASSFNTTAEEAIVKQSIHDAGYAGVTDLRHDMNNGTWHAQAYRNNAYVDVTVDRAGHVSQP
ncbi:MAG: hypothetical protein U1E60_24540 [Reyranellaceae bacterium]